MALNGTLEAFLASISTPKDLANQSWWMVLFSFLTIGVGWTFAVLFKMGDVGLIWANCINSFVRAVYCAIVIRAWFHEKFALARNTSKVVNKTVDTTSDTLSSIHNAGQSGNESLASLTGVDIGKLTNPIAEPVTKPLTDMAKAGGDQIKDSTDFARGLSWTDVAPPKPVWIVFGCTAVFMRLLPKINGYEAGQGFGQDISFVLMGSFGFVACGLVWYVVQLGCFARLDVDFM